MLSAKRIEELLGETVREIGILVLVFAPLDAAFSERAIDVRDVTNIALSGVVLIVAGILLESGD